MGAVDLDIAGTEPQTRAGRIARALGRGPLHVFLILIALFWMTPTFGLLVTSFRRVADASRTGWWTAISEPRQLTLDPYRQILENDNIVRGLLNTLYITVPSVLLVVFLAALAAYAFAWIDFKGRDALFVFVIMLLVVPLQMALIPAARLFGDIGIFGTTWAAIAFHVAFGLPFAIFLLRNFFIGIPHELLEAARIDGASEWQIFSRIILPLGMPAIASLLIFQFLWVWNDLLVGLVFTAGEASPITVVIREQMRQFGSNLDVIAPGAFLSMIVPLIVFFAFQRYFVQGLLAGSVK
ncbi:MAG TPA: carbohydrate ABC transporter permease [Actinomycetota bacterium]|jgi:alpha-glucoside transport system permease protein|nr:carbohydrate ABC transporter permease [Actinomycetota bacterium]